MRRLPSVEYFNLYGGRDDTADAIELDSRKFQEIENFYVDRDSLRKRNGYDKRFTTALESGSPIQRIHQYVDNSDNRRLIYAINGKLFSDNDSARTNITGTLALSSSKDALFTLLNYDGTLYGTDGVNPVFKSASIDAVAAILVGKEGSALPTVARVMGSFQEHLFLADIDDVDTLRKPYRLVWNNPPDDTDWPFDRVNDLNRTQRITAMQQHGEYLLIFQDRSLWYASLNLNSAGGGDQFNFRQLDPRVGCVGQQSVVTTEKGTFFLDRKGMYFIPAGQIGPPTYVGKSMEVLWSGLNFSRLHLAVAAEMPEKNGVLFAVPFGASQQNNNRGIFINYEEWTRAGRDTSPAHSVFTGVSAQLFQFNSLATGIFSGRDRLIGGAYDGFVSTLDETTTDYSEGISATLTTPFYSAGGRSVEKLWYELALDIDLELQKSVSVRVRLFNIPTTDTQNYTEGTTGAAVLGTSFILGNMALSQADFGRIKGRMRGKSRYVELAITAGTSVTSFALHGIILYFRVLGKWS